MTAHGLSTSGTTPLPVAPRRTSDSTPSRGRFFLVLLVMGIVSALAWIAVPSRAQAAGDEQPKSFAEALREGDAKVALRYRFETVTDDAVSNDGRASTLRTTLGYRSEQFHGWRIVLEAENVVDLGAERQHNNLGFGALNNGVRDRPVIADPEITEINQAYLQFVRGDIEVSAGRRELNWGDQRFIGSVGWRQNHQTLDGLMIENRSLDNLLIRYAFVSNVNRIFGDNHPSASHLLNATWSVDGLGAVTAYSYLLDYDRLANASLSTSTLGIELLGQRASKTTPEGPGVTWLYEAEFARQRDRGDNPNSVDADYVHARLGAKFRPLTVEVGWELLGAKPGSGRFSTPLATLHKWNGWADKFLVTPPLGLDDLYVRVGGPIGPIQGTLAFHRFSSDAGSVDYGEEIDAQLSWKAPWNQTFALKGAFYNADSFSTDTDKLMLWTGYSF